MEPITTSAYLKNYVEACSFDQCHDENCLCKNHNSNCKPMSNAESYQTTQAINIAGNQVHKSYEMNNSILSESYFSIDDMDDANDFISDYARGYKNGVILVVNDIDNTAEIQLLTNNLNVQLKHIIVCNSTEGKQSGELNQWPDKIESATMNNAVLTAYNMAVNGQAILFQGVDPNFDFFSYL